MQRMTDTEPSTHDHYYHESGHAVAAKLFEDVFKIEFVTMNEERSEKFDSKSLGGLKGYGISTGELSPSREYNKRMLIVLAGFCTDLIVLHNKNLPSNLLTRDYVRKELSNEWTCNDILDKSLSDILTLHSVVLKRGKIA
jgi:hypothetical protein